MSGSYFDLNIEIDCEDRLRTELYDKKDDFIFPLNFQSKCSNIPGASVYLSSF
jgi:hypothetical protein